MGKRKLCVEDPPAKLCRELCELPGVSQRLARRLVGALREDGQGQRTCSRPAQLYGDILDMVTTVDVPAPRPLQIDMTRLGALAQKKTETCPLYRAMIEAAMCRRDGRLTLVIFSDEAQTGNVLQARQSRKANLAFFAFLEMPALHIDAMWLPLCAMLAKTVRDAQTTYAAVMRAVLEATRAEIDAGFPVPVNGQPTLLFVDSCVLLGDHEGLRSLSGCKGASGLKPCLRCCNVLAKGRALPPGYVGLGSSDADAFRLQTDAGLAETLVYLKGCRTKKALQESETLLGWNAGALESSVLASPQLKGWVSLDSLYFDQMHELWSNGVVCQELGLWYTSLVDAGINITLLRRWVGIGWRAPDRRNLLLHFADALWKRGQDYKGDASACLAALPLCAAFSTEVVDVHPSMRRATTSLLRLYAATTKLMAAKADIAHVAGLSALLEKHHTAFVAAYGADEVRPKMHYLKHIPAQGERWQRILDCFVGERKHRRFKSEYGPRLCALHSLPRSALLHQVKGELATDSQAEQWHGRLLGAPRTCVRKARALRLPPGAAFGTGLEYRAVTYRSGAFLVISPKTAVQVRGGVEASGDLWLLVEALHPGPKAYEAWPTWQRGAGQLALLPVREAYPCEPLRLAREGLNSILLLR